MTEQPRCPLCDAKTVKHPELRRLRAIEYCCECVYGFDPAALVVSTWHDDPYEQMEDGDLVTICRACDKARAEEYAE